jgi:ABC-type sugar transport system ATPase subunit
MTLGDRIAVLGERGTIEQLAPPLELYQRPSNRFVAEFIGMPRINWFEGALQGQRFRCKDFEIATTDLKPDQGPALLGVRPHDVTLTTVKDARLHARVELTEPLGATLLIHARSVYGVPFRILAPADVRAERGQVIGAQLTPEHLHLFERETGKRCAALA